MPNSLKARLGKLKYKDIISDKDYERLSKALELQERFERYTMQDDMHLVTIKQIKEVMKGEWL